jgi:two-component system response regulator DesR
MGDDKTTFGRPGYLRRAMEAGASAFLVKDIPAQELAAAIRKTAARNRIEAMRAAQRQGRL